MLLHQKYTTAATIIGTFVTMIGTAAALSYYLTISKYNSPRDFIALLGGYITVIILIHNYFNRRLKNVREI